MDKITIIKDERGKLISIDFSKVPFEVNRMFSVYGVPKKEVRGRHSHTFCLQYYICQQGAIVVNTNDGQNQDTIILKEGHGLFINKNVWSEQIYMTGNDILVVLCSHEYDPDDYIRDFKEFKKMAG